MLRITPDLYRPKLILALLCLLIGWFIWPMAALAAGPIASGAEPCAECHEAETAAWLDSPHALATSEEYAADCEGCHGQYVTDHPEAGLMQLTVDSTACKSCHTATFAEWENTIHAEADVECIGCHLSHSQEFRLTDDTQCGACHRDRQQDFAHTAHGLDGVLCIDCHMSTPSATEPLMFISTRQVAPQAAPDHDFTQVTDQACLTCHTEDAHLGLPPTDAGRVERARLAAMADTVPQLTDRIETIEQTNYWLQITIPVAFGIGLGMGGMLGVAFMLGASLFSRRRS